MSQVDVIRSGNDDLVGGLDVHFFPSPEGEQAVAVLSVLSKRSLAVVHQEHLLAPAPVPYMPGLLGFRQDQCSCAAPGSDQNVSPLNVVLRAGKCPCTSGCCSGSAARRGSLQ